MTGERKRYSAEFKDKVAMEALRGELTMSQLAAKHSIHQTMIGDWKRQAMEGLVSVFSGKAEARPGIREVELEEPSLTRPPNCPTRRDHLTGGERRLNVAVTRARERLVVFGSLKADQLDLSKTGATGVRHLKRFLNFAEHGARSFATATDGSVGDHESPFETEVAERLHRLGWTTHPQVGVSGFRIDLGVVDPDAPGGYLAGVECDGATYHRGATARDRDRLRQHLLQTLGWCILRIWSTDWWTNAAREADRIHEQLVKALEHARAERATKAEAGAPLDLEPKPDTAGMPSRASADGTMEAVSPVSHDADPELFHDPSYRDRLSGTVAGVFCEQGPIREDKLVQIVARMHGFARAGREIRERVMAVVPDASAVTIEDVGRFVWPPNVAPEAWDTFREPGAGQTADPTELPLSELIALAKRYAAPGLPEDAIVTAMRNACGLQRLGASTRLRCLAALSIASTR